MLVVRYWVEFIHNKRVNNRIMFGELPGWILCKLRILRDLRLKLRLMQLDLILHFLRNRVLLVK